MDGPPIGDEAFVADAERHNEWWNAPRWDPTDLTTVTDLPARSDLHRVVEATDDLLADGVDTCTYPIYGQTGIGKTTLLKQFVATLLTDDLVDYAPSHRDYDVAGAIHPSQILYVPLEDGLYHTNPPDQALDALVNVLDYHRTRIATRTDTRFVVLDDVGAIDLDADRKRRLLDAVGDDTYLYVTGIVASQVAFPDIEGIEHQRTPAPMLPMKFVDAVKQSGYAGVGPGDVTADLAALLEAHQSEADGGHLHRAKKTALAADHDPAAAVGALEDLVFDVLDAEQRDVLAEAARRYLRTGGMLFRAEPDDVRNDLVRSHVLLYLYKELARYESIKAPENLHRLCAIVANNTDAELTYNDVSDALGVDRRTVDTYFDVLAEGLAVTESHEYTLQRHRRTRPYLRNARHLVTFSQRDTHHGYESYAQDAGPNPDFEYALARTVAFDHAMRLSYGVDGTGDVEYAETDAGTVDYVLRIPDGDDHLVLPFALSYAPHGGDADAALRAFDPAGGKHLDAGGDPIDATYHAPHRFLVTDRASGDGGFRRTALGDATLVELPFWVFLLLA